MNIAKYPRTPHLPDSPGGTKDDKRLKDYSIFFGKNIIITEKMDGENISIYKDFWHSRSISSTHKYYHSYLQNVILPKIQPLLANNQKIIGEYLYKTHSIYYDNLINYFEAFMIFQDDYVLDVNLEDKLLTKWNIDSVPLLGFINNFQLKDIVTLKEIAEKTISQGGEGIVIRNVDTFKIKDFHLNVAKYVRKNHIQTNESWLKSKQINKLFNKNF